METLIYYALGFLWTVFTGFVFSTVGAVGGILASFGFISVLHINAANSVKVMGQILIIVSPLIALPVYLRQERIKQVKSILFSVGFIIAAGAIIGALFGSWFSKNYLSELKSFKYLFGYLTFIVVGFMVYNLLNQRKNKAESAKQKSNNEDKNRKDADGGIKINADYSNKTPSVVKFSVKKIDFQCLYKNYSISPIVLFAAGFLIAIVSSIFGVGGGFLIVPFLTDVNDLPVFMAAGISILVVLISSLTSVSNYIRMGVPVIIPILLVALAGVIIGSILGPKISQRLNEKMLKYILMVLLVFIGVFYVFKP